MLSDIFSILIIQLPKSQLENWLTKVDKVVTKIGFMDFLLNNGLLIVKR